MGWFSNIIGKIGSGVSSFFSDPIGKLRQAGNAVVGVLGKAKHITGIVKKAKDFVTNIPVIGDAVQSSGVGGIIDQVDKRVNQVDSVANTINRGIQ